MMILEIMGMTLGPLVRALFLFVLKIPLVVLMTPLVMLMTPLAVFVACVFSVFVPIGIKYNGDVVPLVVFISIGVDFKGGQLNEIFWRPKS